MASRPTRSPSSINAGKAYSAPRIVSATIIADGLLAEVDLCSHDAAGIGLGVLLEIAGDLAARAGAMMSIEHQRWDMTDINAGWVTAPSGALLAAKAVLIGSTGRHCVWQVTLRNPDGATVAHATVKRQLALLDAVSNPVLPVQTGDAKTTGSASLTVLASSAGVPPAPQPETQRDRIAQAAADVIALKGFAQSTVREIAEAAGMHVPTLYTHIASKDDLLELVYTWSMDRILVDVGTATANCRTARDKVKTMISSMLARADENKRRVGVLNRELRSLPHAARERVLARYRTILDQMAQVIAEGVETGEFRPVDPMTVANIIDAACDMRALRPFIFDQVDFAQFEQRIIAFIESGLVRAT